MTAASLDPQQRAVVDRVAAPGHGPTLVLAGPGTGKTTTLVEAISARVDSGTPPEQILTLTFSRRAAAELRTRIARRVQRTVGAPLAWTFHGFGYSLVGEQLAPDDLGRALRLLSGPEQEVVVRDLLSYDREVGTVPWPPELGAALRTRGFTEQVRAFMGRARSLGLGAADVRALSSERADWLALGHFMDEYLDVMDSRGLLDYSELVSRAVAYADSPEGRRRLRERYQLVVVDEYQDTDPAQEQLLQAIAGDGRDLVVVGDPDQSIYAFRGAEVRGITEFVHRFPHEDGSPAHIVTLTTSRRCSRSVLESSRAVARLLGPAGSIPSAQLRAHRALVVPDEAADGCVEVRIFPTVEREAAAIAEVLRREHLHGGTPWSQMAVLVRSGVTSIPGLQRALVVAGVPVLVAVDELPLRDNPTVAPLLALLEYAVDLESLTPAHVHELLLSPLVGASASDVRRLGRALRALRRSEGQAHPPASELLVHAAVLDPGSWSAVSERTLGPALRLAEVLTHVRAADAEGHSAHEVLWRVWNGSAWSRRLIAAAERGDTGAAAAGRSLDAVVSLFDLAARSRDRTPGGDVRNFLAEVQAQEIPAGPLDDVGVRGDGVRLLTAHRSKGLEWDVVVVAGVQADVWPHLRRRGSVIGADRLAPDGPAVPATVADLRREERRLFYVAITRARRRVLCTAVSAPADDGWRPSPFLEDLGVEPVVDSAAILTPLTLAGVVADLRRVLVDDGASPALRREVAARLAVLAAQQHDGRPLAPAAHPDRWWGTLDLTEQVAIDAAALDDGRSLRLSGSQLDQLQACPLRWYLNRRVKAETGRGASAGFGGVLHALADAVARGELPAKVDALVQALDDVWSQLPYRASWESRQEREAAQDAIERFLEWHGRASGREVIATEVAFDETLTLNAVTVQLSGRIDRLERDDGGFVVVDFKTSRTPPARKHVDEDLQLATYRRLVAAQYEVEPTSVKAELVQLRVDQRKGEAGPKVQQQTPSERTDSLLDEALQRAISLDSSSSFPAVPNAGCRHCQFIVTCPAQPGGREVVS
jgi:superfamily I DNA/RNA helicase/RecB family exonuclease